MERVEVEVTRNIYICSKCGKEFTNKKKCARHEHRCGCDHELYMPGFGINSSTFKIHCKKCKLEIASLLFTGKNRELISEFILSNLDKLKVYHHDS